MTDKDTELSFLMKLEPPELRLHLARDGLLSRQAELNDQTEEIATTHHHEQYFIRMSEKYLTYYNEDSREEDWKAFEQYAELAKNTQEYRQVLRSGLQGIAEDIRELNGECQKLQKIMETAQRLKLKTS